jgi:hypothetical protein
MVQARQQAMYGPGIAGIPILNGRYSLCAERSRPSAVEPHLILDHSFIRY